MRRAPSFAATAASVAAAAVLLAGCNDLTQILVVIQSDLEVPSELDAVRVEVTGGETTTASGTLTGSRAVPLPRTVTVVRSGGSAGPLVIRAVGSVRGRDVVERTARTAFADGESRVLVLPLARACLERDCVAGQTCVGGSCGSDEVRIDELLPYEGRVPGFDAGVCDLERCDGVDNDCDARVDEGFMLQSNPDSCGECGRVCEAPNATPGCVSGECVVQRCLDGFGDCNGDVADGCETSLRTSTDCRACGVPCEGAGASCATGTCL